MPGGNGMKSLKGRVAVVTGAASGIGLAMAERFAAEGMKVVLADVEVEPLGRAERSLRSSGAEVLAVSTDVSKADQVDRLAQQARQAFGGVHVGCNNARVRATSGPGCWEMNPAEYPDTEPERTPQAAGAIEYVKQLVAAGSPPADIAANVVDAIHKQRFYVLPHREALPGVRQRMEDILKDRSPVLGPPWAPWRK